MAASNAHHEIAKSRYTLLRDRTHAFCNAFLDLTNNPPEKILAEHFTSDQPRITEHGPRDDRLPFLGQTFAGYEGCLEYFSLLSKTLEFIPNENTFPGADGIVVDDRAIIPGEGHVKGDLRGVTTVVGHAEFRAISPGQSWKETFIYRLSGFDEDGKIGHWEIWADPLSAWTAVGGRK